MSTINYTVKVVSAQFTIDDAVAPKLTFRDGDTYVFDQADSSNSGHILQFSITSNNSGGAEYTVGVTKAGTPGSGGASTTIVTSGSTTDTLYFYSSGGGTYGEEFSNSGFNTSTNYNLLKPIVGGATTAEKWGSMVNHAIDQIDQNITAHAPEGTAVKSTGETGANKFLREDGDNTSSWVEVSSADADTIPHIIPDVLYPAYEADATGAGKLLDGTTEHGTGTYGGSSVSTSYGTVQTDGRKYYFTNIAGSKPIKDPRIGAHFGSQRHKFKSLQILEQETATHGADVKSIDGREWIRSVGIGHTGNNSSKGNGFQWPSATCDGDFIEIVGYFNDANLIFYTDSNKETIEVHVDGGTIQANDFALTVETPLTSRFVDAGSVANLSFNGGNPTLGIHTLKLVGTGSNPIVNIYGIELVAHGLFTDATCDYNNDPTIAHDANTRMVVGMSVTGTGIPTGATIASVTSTTAFELSASTTGGAVTNGTLTFGVADLSIPAQNVVSYGKKFAITEVAQHYDPFNGFTNSTTLHSAVVDTATSLGLSSAPGSSVSWAISGSNNIRPYNGGRVVKWVDSSGVIKTSVNMMPPNAQNISGGVAGTTEVTTPSATNATYTPIFSDDAIDHSQAEVAKTFHIREFGNGGANQGAGGTFADASMLTSSDAIAYVMDDGLTSLSSDDMTTAGGAGASTPVGLLCLNDNADFIFITFIGTGFTMHATANGSGTDEYDKFVDGIQIVDGLITRTDEVPFTDTLAQNLPYGSHIIKITRVLADVWNEYYKEFTFHQPKMPPIPEDACILADYMLMADFVPQTTEGIQYISKGVRRCSSSRDHFYDNGSPALALEPANANSGIKVSQSSSGTTLIRNIGFGTNFIRSTYGQGSRSQNWYVNDTGHSSDDDKTPVGSAWGSFADLDANITLGNNILDTNGVTGDGNSIIHSATDTASPIHTSSHYQTFETPFLHELVGGDRNMEQTNLVVTPDGKTWDEVTRDVSYIGKIRVITTWELGSDDATTFHIPTEWRGKATSGAPIYYMNKDFAIAYDRVICLVSGDFHIMASAYEDDAGQLVIIFVNGVEVISQKNNDAGESGHNATMIQLNRGDYVQVKGRSTAFKEYNRFTIARI